MEGQLYKWHGYISGWTQKYFVLQNGSICYYNTKSERDKNQPAKETLNMGLCEIVVDPHSPAQWELRMPVESKVWHLRTESTPERHQWIKALGSAKACLLDTSSLGSFSRSTSVESSSRLLSYDQNLVADDQQGPSSLNGSIHFEPIKENLDTANDSGNGSMNNLLLTSDTSSFVNVNNTDEENNMSQLSNQCEKTIENIRQLQQCLEGQHSSTHIDERIQQVESAVAALSDLMTDCKQMLAEPMDSTDRGQEIDDGIPSEHSEPDHQNLDQSSPPSSDEKSRELSTFFTSCVTDFGDVMSGLVKSENQPLIPTELFLDACQCYMEFFERFAGTLMGPLKTDIQGNIDKITKVINSVPGYKYLQDILSKEIVANQHTGPDTGTQALLWLTRGLRVMCHFLNNCLSEDSDTRGDTSTSLVSSYTKFLAKHHNWMVQRLFKMGLKMIPSFENFKVSMIGEANLQALKASGDTHWEQTAEKAVIEQGLVYSSNMGKVTSLIHDVYQQYNIEV
uniref:Pleckstrin homology domain-containing family A member 8 n=1 Tax=Phallusia mammillata TaxID=59560 RepID=A0A6F9DP78_9ASCI|nr:pleckstrin homology domain-containing family A member 8 [Phallusia mammillata]